MTLLSHDPTQYDFLSPAIGIFYLFIYLKKIYLPATKVPCLLFHALNWRVRGGLNSSPCSDVLRDETGSVFQNIQTRCLCFADVFVWIVHLCPIPAQVIYSAGQQSTHINRPLKLFTTTLIEPRHF